MPPPFRKHVFVCLNERRRTPQGRLHAQGLSGAAEEAQARSGRAGRRRDPGDKAGCLDNCANGCSVVVYPDAVLVRHVTEADVEEIVEKHPRPGRARRRLPCSSEWQATTGASGIVR